MIKTFAGEPSNSIEDFFYTLFPLIKRDLYFCYQVKENNNFGI